MTRKFTYYVDGDDEGEYTETFKKQLKEARQQIKQGKTITLEEAIKKNKL